MVRRLNLTVGEFRAILVTIEPFKAPTIVFGGLNTLGCINRTLILEKNLYIKTKLRKIYL